MFLKTIKYMILLPCFIHTKNCNIFIFSNSAFSAINKKFFILLSSYVQSHLYSNLISQYINNIYNSFDINLEQFRPTNK